MCCGWSAIPEIENGIFIDYYKNEKIHCKTYYKNFLVHREDGPAIIEYNTHGKIIKTEYWLYDEKIEDDFLLLVIKGLEKTKAQIINELIENFLKKEVKND